MFKKKANTAFNNKAFKCQIIDHMNLDEKIGREQADRLFRAAKELRGIDVTVRGGKTRLANLLGVLPAAITNLQGGRPFSANDLLSAQKIIGCDAIWLRDGAGDMVRGASGMANISPGAQLLDWFEKSTDGGRRLILTAAKNAEKKLDAVDATGSDGKN